jgi:predicted aspartyl protease
MPGVLRVLAALVWVVAAPLAAAAADSAIPFRTPGPDSRHILVEARLGGRGPFTLLLDTGYVAPYDIAMSRRAALRAGAGARPGPPFISRAAVGGPVRFDPWALTGLDLGPVRRAGASVGVTVAVDTLESLFGEPIDGVVGHDFLAGRVVAIDYPCRRVDLAATVPETPPTATLSVAPIRPLLLVTARVNGQGPYQLVFDTGAGTTILSPTVAREAGVATGPTLSLAGAGGTEAGARSDGADIALGGASARRTPLVVSALVERVAREAGARIDGIAGTPLFAGGRVVLDYPGRRLWLLPPGPCQG